MDLHRLRCAVAIADHGSFSEAAVHLDLSQPTLSHAIARLEDELGVRLFDRIPSGARPTAIGERVLGPARRALLEADNVRAEIDAATGSLTGDLRLVGIRTAVFELAELAARFHTDHRRVRLILRDPGGDRDVLVAIRDGFADVGVLRTNSVPDDVDAVPFGEERVVAVFPAGTAPPEPRITRESLSGLEFIAPVAGTRVRHAFDAVVAGLEVPPRIIAESSYQEATLALVRHGVAASLVSSRGLEVHGAEGIDVRPVDGLSAGLSIITSRWPSPAALAFRELAAERSGD